MAKNRIEYTLAFTADTAKAKQQLSDLKNQLTNVVNTVATNQFGLGFTKDIQQASAAAIQLKTQLQNATNVNTGRLDLSKFNHSLKQSGQSLDSYRAQLSKLGPQGQQAFKNLAIAITNSERPIFSLTKSMKKLGESFANTMRWMITTSALTAVTSAIGNAYTYAKDLNRSLNDIRIVTGQSSDEMAKFAERANKAAKSLSASTLAYTKASLIYYQQGLSDKEVEARTDTTIKMSNVTGESADQVSSYMTAIWNNFAEGSQNLDYFADVITALGAATAASSEEIANGLEKFAAIGETVGLSYEYATAALTTIIDKTRQSEDVVGNALKTIFARIQGLQQGETQDDGVTLNKYSKALENVGIQIIESNGELKEMDSILDELGERWSTLGNAEKVALAQTVGGVRQYSQLISLMDNWDSFKENVNIAETSSGSLQEQQNIYAESWEAASKRVKASMEGIWDELISDDFFIDLTNGLATLLDIIKKISQALGGAQGILLGLASAFIGIYQGKLTAIFTDMGIKISTLLGRNREELDSLQAAAERFLQLNLTGEDATVFEIRKRMTQDYVNALKDANAEEKTMINQLMEQNELIANNAAKAAKDAKDLSRSAERSALAPARYQAHVAAESAQIDDGAAQAGAHAAAQMAASKIDEEAEKGWAKHLKRESNKWKKTKRKGKLDEAKEEYTKKNKEQWIEKNYGKRREEVYDKTFNELYTSQGNVYEKTFNEKFAPKQEAYNNLIKAEEAQTVIGGLFTKENQQYDEASIEAMRKNFADLYQKDGGKYLTNLIGEDGAKELDDFIMKLDELEKKQKELKDLESQKKEGEKNPELDKQIEDKQKEIDAKQKEVNDLDSQITKRLTDGVSDADMDARKFFDADQINKIRQAGTAIGENVVQTQNLKNAADGAKDAMKNLSASVDNMAKNLTTGLQGVTSIASGLSSLMSIGKTWDMESDMSVLERLLKTITTVGFALPMVSNGVTNLGKAFAENADDVKGFGSAFGVLWGKLKAFLFNPTTAVIAGIIAIIAMLGYVIYREATKTERALKEANKQLEESKKYVDETKKAYSELKNSIDSLKSAQETLAGMKKGTLEWKEAVLTLNQQVLNLIELYPELIKFMNNDGGILTISEEGLDFILEQQQKEQQAAQQAYAADQINKQKAFRDNEKDRTKYKNRIVYQRYSDENWNMQIPNLTNTNPNSNNNNNNNNDNPIVLDQDALEKIAKTLQFKEDGTIDFDAMGLSEKAQSFKDALQEGVDVLMRLKLSAEEFDIEMRTLNENLASQWLFNHGVDNDMNNYYASGMAKYADKYREQYSSIFESAGDETIRRKYAEYNLGSDAEQKDIDEYVQKLIDNKVSVDTLREVLLSEAVNYSAKQEIDKQIAALEGIEGTEVYDIFKNIIASGGDESSYNALDKDQFDLVSEILSRSDDDELKSSLISIFNNGELFGEGFAQSLTDQFRQANKNVYMEKSKENQEALFQKDLNKAANSLGVEESAFSSYAEQIANINTELEENKQAIIDATSANIKWHDGVEKVSEALEKNKENLKDINKGTWDYYKSLGEVAKAASEMLGVEVSADYVEKHLGDLQKATEGNEDAIKNLQKTAASDWGKNFADSLRGITKEYKYFNDDMEEVKDTFIGSDWADDFTSVIDEVTNRLGSSDISFDVDANTDKALAELIDLTNKAMAAGQMTETQMKDMFSAMGYSPEVSYEDVPQDTKMSGVMTLTPPGEGEPITWNYNMVGENVIRVPKIKDKNGDGTITMTKITPPSSLGGSTKKSSSSGGSQKEKKNSSDEIERYHVANKHLEQIKNNLDKISKAKDKAFGKKRIDLLKEENKELNKQIDAQKVLLKEVEKNLSKDKGALAAYGAKFDKDGVVTNYEELYQQQINKFNNSARGEADEEAFNTFKEIFNQYEETLDLWQETKNTLSDNIDAEFENRIETTQVELELKVDSAERNIKYIEYLLERLDDKAFSAAESVALLGENLENLKVKDSAYKDNLESLLKNEGVSDKDIAKILNGEMDAQSMVDLGLSASTMENIIKTQEDLMENTKQMEEIQRNTWEKIGKVVEETIEGFDEQAKAISHASSVLGHYKNIVELVGQENLNVTDAMMDAAADANINNAMASLNNSKAQLETLREQKATIESDLATKKLTKSERELLEEQLKGINEEIRSAEDTMLSDWENVLEQASQEFDNAVSRTIKAFEKAMSGTFGSFERLQDAFNKQKELDDMYLDDYKKIYELSKLTRDIEKSIDSTDNIAGKQNLLDLQKEINDLEAQGVQLSEYDVKNLRAKYDLRLAEIALEEAQNAKSQVRMTRDTEGNWSYVYTADENKMAEAQQNYEDKLYAMQELNAQYIENLESLMLQSQQKLMQELGALDKTALGDRYDDEVQRITSFYLSQQDIYNAQLNNALGNATDTYSFWEGYSERTGYSISANQDWVNSFEETQLSILTGFETLEEYHQAFIDAVGSPDEEGTLLGGLTEAYDDWSSRVNTVMEEVGISTEGFGEKFTTVIDDVNAKSDEAIEKSEELKDKYTTYMDETVGAVKEFSDKNGKFIQQAIEDNDKLIDNINKLIIAYNTLSETKKKKKDDEIPEGVESSVDNPSITDKTNGRQDFENDRTIDQTSGSKTRFINNEEYQEGYKDGENHRKDGYKKRKYKKNTPSYRDGYDAGWDNAGKMSWDLKIDTGGSQGSFGSNGQTWTNQTPNPLGAVGADTGMYTGSWGSSGKLAILHEKELVLNKKDTENILKSVDMVRNISSMIDLNAKLDGARQQLLYAAEGYGGGGEIMQNITINAEFPDATDRNEIQAAFDNLFNRASQFANRKNKKWAV